MEWFKMAWLDSDERKVLGNAGSILQELSAGDGIAQPVTKSVVGKPYKNIIFSNGNITVVFPDGTVLDKMNVDRNFFEAVRNSTKQSDIESLMMDRTSAPPPSAHSYESEEDRRIISDNLHIIRNHKDFVVNGLQVTLKGVNLPIPAIVLASFIEILEKQVALVNNPSLKAEWLVIEEEDLFDQYHALKMFWLKLALNPLPQSREDLLVFCRKNSVRITNNGNLILYRRIVSKAGADTEYVSFVSQTYYSLKSKGELPQNYAIGKKRGSFYFIDLREEDFVAEELIGNLQHLYLELPEYQSNSFTAAHDNTVTIKIGGIYKIADNKINLNNGLCAAGGLHAAAVDYNYSGFGDTPVVVLVNPSKAITVPTNETGKLRTTEMFVACVNNKPQGKHFDESALASFDSEYHDLSLAELEQAATSKSFDGLSIKDNTPAISLVDLSAIKDMLKNRVKNII